MAILTVMKNAFYNNDGTRASGGLVYTYAAGTTTPVATYTDSNSTATNTNPIVLDAKGEAAIWSNSLLKVDAFEAGGAHITGWPVDFIGSKPSVGVISYRGAWNAATNTPALASGVGTRGYAYIVSVSGTTSIDGNAVWTLADYIIFDGIAWGLVAGGSTAATNANISAVAALASQTAAAVSAASASAGAVNAAASAIDAANGAVAWVSGATYAIGNVRYSPFNFLNYRRIVAGAGTTDPSSDATNWIQIAFKQSVLIATITAVNAATVDFNNSFSSAYTEYELVFTSTYPANTSAVYIFPCIGGVANSTISHDGLITNGATVTSAPSSLNVYAGNLVGAPANVAMRMRIRTNGATPLSASTEYTALGGGGGVTRFAGISSMMAASVYTCTGLQVQYNGTNNISGTFKLYGVS